MFPYSRLLWMFRYYQNLNQLKDSRILFKIPRQNIIFEWNVRRYGRKIAKQKSQILFAWKIFKRFAFINIQQSIPNGKFVTLFRIKYAYFMLWIVKIYRKIQTWKFSESPTTNIFFTKWHVMNTSNGLQFKIEHSLISARAINSIQWKIEKITLSVT